MWAINQAYSRLTNLNAAKYLLLGDRGVLEPGPKLTGDSLSDRAVPSSCSWSSGGQPAVGVVPLADSTSILGSTKFRHLFVYIFVLGYAGESEILKNRARATLEWN